MTNIASTSDKSSSLLRPSYNFAVIYLLDRTSYRPRNFRPPRDRRGDEDLSLWIACLGWDAWLDPYSRAPVNSGVRAVFPPVSIGEKARGCAAAGHGRRRDRDESVASRDGKRKFGMPLLLSRPDNLDFRSTQVARLL
jgi:hypothetical protein